MSIKRNIQQWLAKWLSELIIPVDKTTGFSLVRTERKNASIENKARVYAPYFLHNVTVGDYSYVANNSNITNCMIGRFCSIGPNFCCG